MDINLIRTILTVTAFAVFIGIVLWAWSGRRRAAFDEAARLPFSEDNEK
jgi:cytochrome c oxidase cbb3-type subunit 4